VRTLADAAERIEEIYAEVTGGGAPA
jgi:hypothetical protein